MTMRKTKPAVGGGRGLDGSLPGRNRLYVHFIPTALAMQKRGRECIIAKLTAFEGSSEPILAVAWRGQRGTEKAISMPVAALEYARQRGATQFYLRDDRAMTMLTCDLATFDRGRLQADGERYIPLSWLQPAAWRPWTFAEKTVHLEPPEQPSAAPAAQQLAFFGGEGA